MSTPLNSDDARRYSRIIDGILATADLATISRKKIRSELQEQTGKDLSEHKLAIKHLIEERFDAISSQAESSIPTPEVEYSPYKRSAADEDDAEGEEETPAPVPIRKKQKRESSIEDQDAKLAAKLQAEENSLGRVRKTRGGNVSKPAKKPAKRKPKQKSRKTVDESDVEGAEDKPKRNTGFQKPMILSEPLAILVGEDRMSRPQVVKKIWDHIKGNSLQDPSDKRQINCDELMHAVFKQNRVHMFSMNKLLGAHLYPVEDVNAGEAPQER